MGRISLLGQMLGKCVVFRQNGIVVGDRWLYVVIFRMVTYRGGAKGGLEGAIAHLLEHVRPTIGR